MIEIKVKTTSTKFDNYTKRMSNFKEILTKSVEEVSIANKQDTFNRLNSSGQSLDMKPFHPLSPKYLAWKIKNFNETRIGILTGSMRDKLDYDVITKQDTITGAIGTTAHRDGVPYPAFFHQGTEKMPARPFAGFDDTQAKDAIKLVLNKLKI
jgi:phage gpG-like protein